MAEQALEMFAGADETFAIGPVLDVDGNPIDITGVDLEFRAWLSVRDSVPHITKTATVTNGPQGLAEVALIPTDTDGITASATLDWSLWATTGDQRPLAYGTLFVRVVRALGHEPAPQTYDPATDQGKVRLLAQDTDVRGEWIFTDDEIQAFLDLNGGNIFYAAAQGLEVIAASEIYVQKRIKILDLWTDGPRQAEQLIALAKSYRERAVENMTSEELFDWAEHVFNDFTYRERLLKQVQRELV